MQIDELIEYMESLGLEIHTTTKARGHLGFFLDGRIDISKSTPQERLHIIFIRKLKEIFIKPEVL